MERVDDLRALARLVVDLLVRAGGEEQRERVDDRQQPVAGHSGRGGDHVLLRDPALEERVGVRELERARAAVGGEVGVEDDEVVALCPQLEQRPPVSVHHVLVRHGGPCTGSGLRLTSEVAGRRLDLDGLERGRFEPERGTPLDETIRELCARAGVRLAAGAPACQRYVPPPSASARGCSMNETPLPLTVRATSAFGTSPARSSAKAPRSAEWS